MIILISAIFVGCQSNSVSTATKYSQVERSTRTEFKNLEQYLQHDDKFTIVLLRKGCPACENVEKELAGDISKLQQANENVVVLDLTKTNSAERSRLLLWLPGIQVDGGKLASPTVANFKSNGRVVKMTAKAVGDDITEINKVIKR